MKRFYLTPQLFLALRGYTGAQFVKDAVAGIIVAIIALPLSIALALASGVEPACGIYTAIAAGFVVSLLGGSSVQIAGPTAAFATVVAGIVATQGMDGLFIATVLAGLLLIVMGVCRLGSLIKFIPFTVTTGFTAGIAVTIFLGQIKDFCGITYAAGVRPVETLEKLAANFKAIGTVSWQALLVGAVCLAVLILYPKVEKRIPPSLVAVIVGALMVRFIPGLDGGVYTIGELYTIPSGLPTVDFAGFDFSPEKIAAVLPSAVTIAVLAGIESLLSCVVADGMVGSKHNSNAELVAQGVGNIASVLFGGIPATGAIARTAANIKNGGRTPVAGMVHAVVLLLVLLFLMPYAGLIPMPTIAAILFAVAYNMSEWRRFVRIVRTAPKSDVLVMAVTFAFTVVFDLVVAIAAGLVLAALLFIARMNRETRVTVRSETLGGDRLPVPPHVRVYEISGPLFFGVADKIGDLADAVPAQDVRVMILDMRAVTALDATAVDALQTLHSLCAARAITLVLSDVGRQPLAAMQKAGLVQAVGEQNICPHIGAALQCAAQLS